MKTYFGRISIENKPKIIESVRLTINKKKYEIEFSSSERSFRNIKLIHGIFNGLGDVTLINCRNTSSESGAGAEINRYQVNYILKGIQIENLEDFFFDCAYIRMQGLLDWTKLYSVEYLREGQKRSLIVKDLEKILFHEGNLFSIKIYAANTISLSRNPDRRTIIENAGFEITSKLHQKHNFWDYLEVFRELQKIVLILGNRKTDINFANFHKEGIDPVDLLWKDSISIGQPSTMGPFVEFKEIQPDLDRILKTWFGNKDIHTSIDLILEKSINVKLSRENHFLNNCFALETFHRRFKNYKLFDKEEFKSIKSNILQSIENPELSKLIENNLAHINEPNFRSRLLDFKTDFTLILPSEWDTSEYIRKVVKTRNYLVHRSSAKNILDKFDMLYAAFFLELITRIYIYKILGLKEELCHRLLEQNGERIQGFYFSHKRMRF